MRRMLLTLFGALGCTIALLGTADATKPINMDQYKFHMSKVLGLYTNGLNVHKLGNLMVSVAYSFSPAEDRPLIEECLGKHDNETAMELITCYMEKMKVLDASKKCEVKKLKELLHKKMAAAPPVATAVLQKYAECVCQPSGAESMICVQQKTMDYAKTFCSAIVGDD
ncbi:uncharacterized protein LOC114828486 [Galendromus occidentalis]|uniref:Uncharacterized protein LOC114828486 n=1 Tax=Galendromus occidentalis TaxID=34638 RepID=A0AAJ7SHM2_9ACAR|nr:uncharacterized protein LOC114828486 [Galendromus occidentalis]